MKKRGLIEIVFAMILAGSTVPAGKILGDVLPPFLTTFLSLSAGVLVLLPLLYVRRQELRKLNRFEIGRMTLQALFGIVLFRFFLIAGLQRTSALHAGVILGTAPAVMAVTARIFLKERLPLNMLPVVALSVVGLVVLRLTESSGVSEEESLAGDILVLAAVVSETLLTIFRKQSRAQIGSSVNTTVLCLIAMVLTLPLAAIEWRHTDRQVLGETRIILALIYYGTFGTAVAYILWGDGAPRIPAWLTGLGLAILPVTSSVLAILLLGDRPTPTILIGGGCVLLSILWAGKTSKLNTKIQDLTA